MTPRAIRYCGVDYAACDRGEKKACVRDHLRCRRLEVYFAADARRRCIRIHLGRAMPANSLEDDYVKGVAEPSLASSISGQPLDLDGGLLISSEVAQLNLNADWWCHLRAMS